MIFTPIPIFIINALQMSRSGQWVRAFKLATKSILLGLLVPSAWAQTGCPAASALQQASLEQLAKWAEACDENAFFHAHRGAVLLAQGQTESAAVALEKALLLNPDLPGAQLDFAQALAQIGLKGSARAMLQEVLQRPDIQPSLKAQLLPAENATASSKASEWQWSNLFQSSYGYESNLNSATYTDKLTLYLSNGPVTLGLSDNVKPLSGNAFKTAAVLHGSLKGLEGHEFSVNVALADKTGAANLGGNSNTAEGTLRYSLPLVAGAASGRWQVAVGGTQFWLGQQKAYADQGLQIKFAWDSLGATCKWVPALGRIDQGFPQASTLNGVYTYGRLDWVCRSNQNQETHVAFGGGQDKAQTLSRPGGNRRRADLMVRHEQIVRMTWLAPVTGQFSAWMRYAHSQDSLAYSELLGDLKSSTHRTDLGLGFWAPIEKQWFAGINLEATSQRSNNTLFNLKNSGVYVGLRWVND